MRCAFSRSTRRALLGGALVLMAFAVAPAEAQTPLAPQTLWGV